MEGIVAGEVWHSDDIGGAVGVFSRVVFGGSHTSLLVDISTSVGRGIGVSTSMLSSPIGDVGGVDSGDGGADERGERGDMRCIERLGFSRGLEGGLDADETGGASPISLLRLALLVAIPSPRGRGSPSTTGVLFSDRRDRLPPVAGVRGDSSKGIQSVSFSFPFRFTDIGVGGAVVASDFGVVFFFPFLALPFPAAGSAGVVLRSFMLDGEGDVRCRFVARIDRGVSSWCFGVHRDGVSALEAGN